MLGNLFNQRNQPEKGNKDSAIVNPSVSSLQNGSLAPSTKHDLSVLTHLDNRAASVLSHAKEEAQRQKQPFIEPSHILFGLLFDSEIFSLLEKFSLNVSKISDELQKKSTSGIFTAEPTLSQASKSVFEDSYTIAKGHEASFIAPEDILVSLFSQQETSSFLSSQGLKKEQLDDQFSRQGTMVGKKSYLSRFGNDLTDQAKKGELDPVSGREKEIERLVHILLRRTKNNPIILGEAGVGKTALIEGLAQKIVGGLAPKELVNKKIIQLDLPSLVAGASHRGEFEERLRSVIKEVQLSQGKTILFIDEIHTLIGAGDTEGALDASNIIKPFLARGQMQVIGTTTTSEFRKYFQKDKAFERRFQPILLDEPTEEVAVEMLKIIKQKYEKFHGVTFPDETLVACVHLSKKYIGERYLPDKAVDLLDESAAEVKLAHEASKRQDTIVTQADIEKVVSDWTGIPVTKLTEDEGQKLLHLEEFIHKRIVDQEQAVSAVAEAVRRGRIGLSSASRPIASFIFLGPTGVGKTELAKTLAEILFGKQDALTRIDMSEYMEKHEVAKLIGAPPGYVGYEEGGQLTEAVRRKPYSIILLDELEKAHPDVFNILLQILEDGRLTDNKGNTASFKNTIIIATSNIGSQLIEDQLIKNKEENVNNTDTFTQLTKLLGTELRKFLKPELLNRFDELVVFKPLLEEHMKKVAQLGIENTRKLLKEQGFEIQISEAALMQLSKEGYDPSYGARPLRRLIQTAVENPIAVAIIAKQFTPGDTILIDYNQTESTYLFTKQVKNSTQEVLPQESIASQSQQAEQNSPVQNTVSGMQMPQPIIVREKPVDNNNSNGNRTNGDGVQKDEQLPSLHSILESHIKTKEIPQTPVGSSIAQ